MAVVAPQPLTSHPQSSSFSCYKSPSELSTPSPISRSASSSSTCTLHSSRRPPLKTLEDLALEIQRSLGSSPSAAFSYLSGEVYNHKSVSSRTRSLPNINRKQVKSSNSVKPPLRKVKSVRFADTQGLPLVEAVHQLTLKDSSYTANKIVPYDEKEDILSEQPLIITGPDASSPVRPDALTPKNSSHKNGTQRNGVHKKQNSPTKHTAHKHTFTFTQPSLEPDFFIRVSKENVVLESIREEPRSLHGIVRVSNLSYSKEVTIRWTHDNWRTSHDTSCVFCSNDEATDRFAFELPINGDDVSFAIRYRVLNAEYWDNNKGRNYTVLSRP